MKKRKVTSSTTLFKGRQFILMMVLMAGLGVLLLRAAWLEVFQQDWLQSQADKRQMRVVKVPPYRGMVVDRHGEPLAVSSPAVALACDPMLLLKTRRELKREYDFQAASGKPELTYVAETKYREFEDSLEKLAGVLNLSKAELVTKIENMRSKRFMYLDRQMPPEAGDIIEELELTSVRALPEYRRFYPMSEMTGHVVGFTNIDGKGVEGIERFSDERLAGQEGRKRVVRDGKGRLIENVEQLEAMIPGRDVQLTLDRRIQYAAYKALKNHVYKMEAKAGSAVVLDTRTSEILAMVNMPAFNPNNRRNYQASKYRNRAVMDTFEPGSTVKPLTVAAALDARVIGGDVEIMTAPGFMKFGNYTIRDATDFGTISVSKVLARSSNVGASKIAMLMSPRQHWMFLNRLGFGHVPDAGFPNEAVGTLTHYKSWKDVDHASHGYGYGHSVSLLQLANSYTIFATGGVIRNPTIYPRETIPAGQRVLSRENADAVRMMMEAVLAPRGTGTKARVDGYRVAGKTGTAYKIVNKKYRKDKRVVSFVGLAPVTDPRVVIAVMLDEPQKENTGGRAAAPLFSDIMEHTLRVMDIPPDKYLEEQEEKQRKAQQRQASKKQQEANL